MQGGMTVIGVISNSLLYSVIYMSSTSGHGAMALIGVI